MTETYKGTLQCSYILFFPSDIDDRPSSDAAIVSGTSIIRIIIVPNIYIIYCYLYPYAGHFRYR